MTAPLDRPIPYRLTPKASARLQKTQALTSDQCRFLRFVHEGGDYSDISEALKMSRMQCFKVYADLRIGGFLGIDGQPTATGRAAMAAHG